MSDKPKALQMADDLDRLCDGYDSAIAAELRRLHALNAELVEALRWIGDYDLKGCDLVVAGHMAHGFIGRARAALAEPQTTHWEGCEAVHPECKGKNT